MRDRFFSRRHLPWLLFVCATPLVGCGSSTKHPSGASDDEREKYLNETSTNWAMARGYPRGTAFNPFEQELNPQTVADLDVVWEAPSQAQVAVQHTERVFSTAGEAYDLQSGELLWSAEQALPTATVCKGALFATGPSIEKRSVKSGELSYSVEVGADAALFSPPSAKDSKVFFATAAESAGNTSEPGGSYVAFDVVEKTAQTIDVPGKDYRTLAPAALTSGMLYSVALEPTRTGFRYVAFATVFDADAAMNRKPWATVLDDEVSSPAELPRLGAMVIGARVFVTSADRRAVVALDQRTGDVLWRTSSAGVIESLAVNFDFAYAAGTGDDGQVGIDGFAFDTGEMQFSLGFGAGTLTGQLAIGGDLVYLGTGEGALLAIDGSSGSLLKRVELGGTVGAPIVTQGKVFVGTGERIVALGLPPATP
ncbi:MAG TPA: PQQ-binding-like beta-propeller repeat protein [Polyangiaceae bacterium]|nr:PQQ-binding-like beta-propeller repeat protein [Polyangiaceae bacterium]